MPMSSWSTPSIRTIKESKFIVTFHYFCQTSAGHQILEYKHSFAEELSEKSFGTSEYNRAFQECIDPMQDHVMDCLYHSSDICHVCQEASATRVMVATKYLLNAPQPLVKNFTSVICQSQTCEAYASKAMRDASERLDARMEYLERSLWPEVVYPAPIAPENFESDVVQISHGDDSVSYKSPAKSVIEDVHAFEEQVLADANTSKCTVVANTSLSEGDGKSLTSVVEAIAASIRDSAKQENVTHCGHSTHHFSPRSAFLVSSQASTRPLSITKAPSLIAESSKRNSLARPDRSSDVPRITIYDSPSGKKMEVVNPSSPSVVDSATVDEAVSKLASADLGESPISPLLLSSCVESEAVDHEVGQIAHVVKRESNTSAPMIKVPPCPIINTNTRQSARSVDLVEYRDATMQLIALENEQRNFLEVVSISSSSLPKNNAIRRAADGARQFRTAAKKTLTCVSMRKIKSHEVLSRQRPATSCHAG